MSLPSADVASARCGQVRTNTRSISRICLTGSAADFTTSWGCSIPTVRGLSPTAGVLHLVVDPMLRQGRGKDTPMLVIHGVHDFIFPVEFTRQTCDLLKSIGYNVTYKELPDWGHAYPYSINERMVLPWFESLPAK